MPFAAKRMSLIKPSPTIAVTNKARELQASGLDIIGLGAGEPDFGTPDNVSEAAITAIRAGDTKYTAVDGTPALKKAICAKFKRENDLDYTPSQITVACGAKQVIFNALLATIDEGDEVIVPAPYWVSYPDIAALCGGKPVIVETTEENGFKLQPMHLESAITERTKWLILNAPSNPTGGFYRKEDLQALADVLLRYPHVHILSDDIYEHILYDGEKFLTLAQVEPKLKDRILTVNGVSKAYSMTGWRIGYAAGDEKLIKAIAMIQSQSTSNPCSISQAASVEALNGTQGYIKERCDIFQKRRDYVVSTLNAMDGISCYNPGGAFYVFPSCKGLFGRKTPKGQILENSNDVASYLLEDALIALVPGIAFGADDYLRISYATSDEILREAMSRMQKAIAALS